jgi:hypothetical protein
MCFCWSTLKRDCHDNLVEEIQGRPGSLTDLPRTEFTFRNFARNNLQKHIQPIRDVQPIEWLASRFSDNWDFHTQMVMARLQIHRALGHLRPADLCLCGSDAVKRG